MMTDKYHAQEKLQALKIDAYTKSSSSYVFEVRETYDLASADAK